MLKKILSSLLIASLLRPDIALCSDAKEADSHPSSVVSHASAYAETYESRAESQGSNRSQADSSVVSIVSISAHSATKDSPTEEFFNIVLSNAPSQTGSRGSPSASFHTHAKRNGFEVKEDSPLSDEHQGSSDHVSISIKSEKATVAEKITDLRSHHAKNVGQIQQLEDVLHRLALQIQQTLPAVPQIQTPPAEDEECKKTPTPKENSRQMTELLPALQKAEKENKAKRAQLVRDNQAIDLEIDKLETAQSIAQKIWGRMMWEPSPRQKIWVGSAGVVGVGEAGIGYFLAESIAAHAFGQNSMGPTLAGGGYTLLTLPVAPAALIGTVTFIQRSQETDPALFIKIPFSYRALTFLAKSLFAIGTGTYTGVFFYQVTKFPKVSELSAGVEWGLVGNFLLYWIITSVREIWERIDTVAIKRLGKRPEHKSDVRRALLAELEGGMSTIDLKHLNMNAKSSLSAPPEAPQIPISLEAQRKIVRNFANNLTDANSIALHLIKQTPLACTSEKVQKNEAIPSPAYGLSAALAVTALAALPNITITLYNTLLPFCESILGLSGATAQGIAGTFTGLGLSMPLIGTPYGVLHFLSAKHSPLQDRSTFRNISLVWSILCGLGETTLFGYASFPNNAQLPYDAEDPFPGTNRTVINLPQKTLIGLFVPTIPLFLLASTQLAYSALKGWISWWDGKKIQDGRLIKKYLEASIHVFSRLKPDILNKLHPHMPPLDQDKASPAPQRSKSASRSRTSPLSDPLLTDSTDSAIQLTVSGPASQHSSHKNSPRSNDIASLVSAANGAAQNDSPYVAQAEPSSSAHKAFPNQRVVLHSSPPPSGCWGKFTSCLKRIACCCRSKKRPKSIVVDHEDHHGEEDGTMREAFAPVDEEGDESWVMPNSQPISRADQVL